MLSDRIAVGRALWRELVIGFARQLGTLDLGFTQLAALYAVAGPVTAHRGGPCRAARALALGGVAAS